MPCGRAQHTVMDSCLFATTLEEAVRKDCESGVGVVVFESDKKNNGTMKKQHTVYMKTRRRKEWRNEEE